MPWLAQFLNPQKPTEYDPFEKVFCCGEHSESYAERHALRIRACRCKEVAVASDRCAFCGSKDLA